MASTHRDEYDGVSTEKNVVRIASRQDMQHWLENAPKIAFGKHQLCIDLSDGDEFFAQKAKNELRETPEIVALGYKELRELIAGEPDFDVPNDEEFYIRYLRPCKWYAKSAFSLMTQRFRFRQNYPHIFTNFVPSKEKIGLSSGMLYPLPFRTKSGSRIMIMEAGKRWKPKEVPLDDCFKCLKFLFTLFSLEPKTQIAGVHVIIDVEGLSLNQVTYFTPSFAKMMIDFVQNISCVRLKGIHVVNQTFVFNVLFAIFKPFLQEKTRKRIIFHGTNWKSVMTSTLTDKNMLLTRHGGELEMPDGPFGTILWQNMLLCESVFEAEEHYGYKTVKSKK